MRNYETRHQTRKIPFPNEDFKTVIAVSSARFYPKSQKVNAIELRNSIGHEASNEELQLQTRVFPNPHFPCTYRVSKC